MQEPLHAPAQTFNAGEVIIGHVSNSDPSHPLIHLPTVWGIDLSVSKHVFMIWLVAAAIFVVVTALVRRYVRQTKPVPTGLMNLLELTVVFIRDEVVRPNVGDKWVRVWTPFLLTLFLFILCANVIGLVPIFDVLALVDHTILRTGEHSFLQRLIHGGSTATGELQRHGRPGDDQLRGDHLGRARWRTAS